MLKTPVSAIIKPERKRLTPIQKRLLQIEGP